MPTTLPLSLVISLRVNFQSDFPLDPPHGGNHHIRAGTYNLVHEGGENGAYGVYAIGSTAKLATVGAKVIVQGNSVVVEIS